MEKSYRTKYHIAFSTMPKSKIAEKIFYELDDLGELYALPKALNGYTGVIGTNSENGMHYRAMNVNRDLRDWLRSSIQSLLLHVMGEMPEIDPTIYGGIVQHTERGKIELAYKQGLQKGRNAAITDCIAVIQSTIDSIKE